MAEEQQKKQDNQSANQRKNDAVPTTAEEWMKALIRKTYNIPQNVEIDISQLNVERVAQQEPLEDTVTLVKCPYCRAHHQKYLVDLCPMNPYKVR